MANLGDLFGLVTKTISQNSGTIASTIGKAVNTVQKAATVSAVKSKYQPGQIISPQDVALLKQAPQPAPQTTISAPKGPSYSFSQIPFEEQFKLGQKETDVGTRAKVLAASTGQAIQKGGEEVVRRVDDLVKQEQPGSLKSRFLETGKAIIGTPLSQIGEGLQTMAGGKDINETPQGVKGLTSTIFGGLGATPGGMVFNGIIAQPEIKPLADKVFATLDSAKQTIRNLPLIKDLPEEAKAVLDIGVDILPPLLLHKAGGKFFKTSEVVEAPHPVTGEMVKMRVPVDTAGWRIFKQDLVKQINEIKANPLEFLKKQQVGASIKDVSGEFPKPPEFKTPEQIQATVTAKPKVDVFDADAYVKEMTQKREPVKVGSTIKQGFSNFIADVKAKIVDSSAPIEDAVRTAQKEHKFQLSPEKDISNQIDRVLRSPSLAGQFMEDAGLAGIIKDAPDINKLDQYLIAKQALKVEERGITTGRNLKKDTALVQTLSPEYEGIGKQVTKYSEDLLDYAVDSGLVSKALATELKQIYPDYVPIARIFSELEKAPVQQGAKSVASLSKQTIVERLKSSDKEIESPLQSLMIKTNDAFNQGERNKAAKILAEYRDLPGFEDKITELKPGEKAPFTFSYLENGEKRTFKTTKEIAESAKRLNVEEAGLLIKLLRAPVRLFKAGTTGFEPSFIATNIVKDQMTAFINSEHGMKTSIANPVNFVKALFSTLKHDDLYKEMVKEGGGGTSFDVNRGQAKQTIASIRSTRSVPERVKYLVTNPAQMLRAIEDIVGKSEELTRLSQYKGTRDALLAEGRTPKDARILAAKAARETTANFSRKGEWGDIVNTIPYFNASAQGSRALIRSFKRSPGTTAFKIASTVFLPMAVATAWNIADPERKKAYDDIADYEKEGNFILVPPNPTKDEKTGKWNVIKVPMAPGASSLSTPVRKSVEGAYNTGPTGAFMDLANSLIETVSPLSVKSPSKFLGNITPQLIKPAIENVANYDFFKESPIVPRGLEGLSPKLQTKGDTSDIAKIIGNTLSLSPIQIDHLIGGYTGKLGTEITKGIDPLEAIAGRFTKASGGKEMEKAYNAKNQADTENKDYNYLLKQSVDKLMETKTPENKEALGALLNELDKDKQTYVKTYIKDKLSKKSDKTQGVISGFNAEAAIKYYGDDLDSAIRTQDKKGMLRMIAALDSEKAQKELLEYIIKRKKELNP